MALRMLSYTTLRLLDLVKMVNIRENEGLYLVFPHCYIQWRQGMESVLGSGGFVRSHAGEFEVLSSQHRYFLLDESCVPGEELDKSKGLVAQLLRLERVQESAQVRRVVRELIARLHGSEYLPLRRAFTVWLVVLSLNALE